MIETLKAGSGDRPLCIDCYPRLVQATSPINNQIAQEKNHLIDQMEAMMER